jgi:hypothetical protein
VDMHESIHFHRRVYPTRQLILLAGFGQLERLFEIEQDVHRMFVGVRAQPVPDGFIMNR